MYELACIPVVGSGDQPVARRLLSGERAGHTLQPTALTNEVLVKSW